MEGTVSKLFGRYGYLPILLIFASLVFVPAASAQYDQRQDRDRVTRIEPGTQLTVRTTQSIDVERQDNTIYHGIVDQDVRGENGRLAIPRGAPVDLRVRVAPDNDLVIDVDSVVVNGDRYTLDTSHEREDAQAPSGFVGSILNNVPGVQVRGRAVRVPRDAVLTFRIERPLLVNAVHHDDHDYDRDRDRDRGY